MLNDSLFGKLSALILINFLLYFKDADSAVAPILDIENESVGYLGTIGERNVLVDLKPHLQIKNIDAINGICSYHVFKPTSEEFPFTIDIKDKATGEAVIEVIRKEVESAPNVGNQDSKPKTFYLDCNKRKQYDFLIQAHDCSSPSLPSNKVPVKIEVIDHDDFVPKFEQDGVYKKTLIESDDIYEGFMAIRAKDNDCTNDGYACTYQIISNPAEKLLPFKIDNTGLLSTLRSVKKGEYFEFKVRAFDCLNNQSFVDAQVMINVVEPCVPQWIDYPVEILSILEKTNIFESLKSTSCDQINQNLFQKKDSMCQIDSVSTKLNLNLDPSIQNNCQKNKCLPTKSAQVKSSKIILFSGGAPQSKPTQNDEDDDSIEDEDDLNDENKIISSNGLLPVESEQSKQDSVKIPLSYRSFSKSIENAQKIDFDGKFGNEFVLSAWLRRPANADKTIKEQVLCGTDSKSMNRHHFGLYFYRGNLKFLLRRESTEQKDSSKQQQDTNSMDSSNIDSNEAFYPSLWEWSLYEPILSDAKWHFYEIKVNYPNVSLFIDGVKFVENTTNSDIIDAYELNDASDTGPITSYVGACYHARTQTLTDHFEGDVGNIVLSKLDKSKQADLSSAKTKCKPNCNEFIDANLAGNDKSIESAGLNEISIKTSNLNDMTDTLKKINYINKETYPQPGSRSIKISTTIHCANTGKEIEMNPVIISINMKRQKTEYKIQLEGEKQLFASKLDLENGIEPFKDVSITKTSISKSNEENSAEENVSEDISTESADSLDEQSIKLSKCQIKITPERNLMEPTLNNEKVMFLQNLLDEFSFKFEETINTVLISGVQSMENYETFIRRLTYVIINVNRVEASKLALIKNKKFSISCTRADTNAETNSVLVQVNLTKNEPENAATDAKNVPGLVAHKQLQKYVVSENDEDIVQKKTAEFSPLTSSNNVSNPMVVALLVMASCAIGFLLVFGAIKLYTSKIIGQKRKALPNEENPQMEWDDSGLNITENPLETLEINKETGAIMHQKHSLEYDDDEFTSSDEDDDKDYNDEDQYSSEEEPEKVVDRELEWDDTSLEIKVRDKQLQEQQLSKNLSNKSASNFIDPNKFV